MAHVTRLPALHSALTETYFRALRGTPLVDANGTPILDSEGKIQWTPPSANVLKACNEFLKQNGIDREPTEASGLPAVAKAIRQFDDDPILIEEAEVEEDQ